MLQLNSLYNGMFTALLENSTSMLNGFLMNIWHGRVRGAFGRSAASFEKGP